MEKPIPARVLINNEGEALSVERAKRFHNADYNVVLIRNDGWSLGCNPSTFNTAVELWRDYWTKVWFNDRLYDFKDFIEEYGRSLINN